MLPLKFAVVCVHCFLLFQSVDAYFRTQQILSQQIMIDYGLGSKLANVLNPAQKQLYVDIGAYDPIVLSKTVELRMEGWEGINIEPHPTRFLRFLQLRPDQINLNLAIGESAKFVNLNSFRDSPYTTINQNSPLATELVDTVAVPSMKLQELCQRYYHRRPKLINIGTFDCVDKILESNDWLNSKCVPDMIVIATNPNSKPSQISKLPEYQALLTQKSFTRFSVQWENTEVYIRDELTKRYRDTYIRVAELLKPKTVLTLNEVLSKISEIIKTPIALTPKGDSSTVYIVRCNQTIVIPQVIDRARRKPEQASTIIMLGYNPQSNPIVLESCDFSVNRLSTDSVQILNLTVGNTALKQRAEIYIFDHDPSRNAAPKIIVTGSVCRQAALGGRFIPATSTQQQGFNSNLQARAEPIGDFIIQIVFVVIFMVFFSILNTIIIVYLCKSFRNHTKAQKQELANRKMSDMVSSVVNE